MRRIMIATMAGLVLLAGCTDEADPDPPAQAVPAPTPPPSASPAVPAPAETEPDALSPEQWRLHKLRTCDDSATLCNCGSFRLTMDRETEPGDCASHGARPLVPGQPEGGCPGLCFQATQEMAPFPADSLVRGTLFVTTDAVDMVEISLHLVEANEIRGTVRLGSVLVTGAGGFEYTTVPFEFRLDSALDRDRTMFQVDLQPQESAFLGFDDPHPSGFTISPP